MRETSIVVIRESKESRETLETRASIKTEKSEKCRSFTRSSSSRSVGVKKRPTTMLNLLRQGTLDIAETREEILGEIAGKEFHSTLTTLRVTG